MSSPHPRSAAIALVAIAFLAACGGGSSSTAPTTSTSAASRPTTTTTAAPEGSLDEVQLNVQEVAKVTLPTALAGRPSSRDLYVTEQRGTVRLIKVTEPTTGKGPLRYQLQTTPVLDLTSEVLAGGEQGMLGLAFSSDGRKLYVDFTARPDGHTRVVEYVLGDRSTVDRASRRLLLEVPQPAANHNGGGLVMGPDGYLYIGLGDGGGSGDPKGNGQDRQTLLGSILRIDPEGGDATHPYGIPAGNPFADGKDGRPELWLYGVRNPWRFSFDTDNGDLWIGDVGQDSWEEISRLPATGGFDAGRSANLGWNALEGTHRFKGAAPVGSVPPIYEYSHKEGCSVTGGYVYRGAAIEALRGSYLFADYCSPGLRALQVAGGKVIDEQTWLPSVKTTLSFGEDNEGEIFVLLGSGSVQKLVPTGTKG